MKNLFFSLAFIMATSIAIGQIPQAISFQGLARDANGTCIASQNIALGISILENGSSGTSVYSETHNTSTDAVGIFNVVIGQGTQSTNLLSDVDWSTRKWIDITIDGSPLGTIELLTVPFSFFSENGKLNVNGNEYLEFFDSNEVVQGSIVVDANGKSSLLLKSPAPNAGVEAFHDAANNSVFKVKGKAARIEMGYTDAAGKFPSLTLFDAVTGGNDRVQIRIDESGNNSKGNIFLESAHPDAGIEAFHDNADNSVFKVRGKASRIEIGYADAAGTRPCITLYDAVSGGNPQVNICIDANGQGIIEKDMVNFVMDHPIKTDKEIVYACIEGPEAAAYERGTTQLVNGKAFIRFSEHFGLVINPETLTVSTSPWSATSKGLAVVERSPEGFWVEELFNGTGNYAFDWEVKGVRKGFEGYKVIREKIVK